MDNVPFWISLSAVAASFALMGVMKLRRRSPRLDSPQVDDLPDGT